jgi:hypothetical protein
VAISKEKPTGGPGDDARSGEYTVLQRHVEFFDRDGDGVITPVDTFVGFRHVARSGGDWLEAAAGRRHRRVAAASRYR